jgi:hypothetical protein
MRGELGSTLDGVSGAVGDSAFVDRKSGGIPPSGADRGEGGHYGET